MRAWGTTPGHGISTCRGLEPALSRPALSTLICRLGFGPPRSCGAFEIKPRKAQRVAPRKVHTAGAPIDFEVYEHDSTRQPGPRSARKRVARCRGPWGPACIRRAVSGVSPSSDPLRFACRAEV